MNKVLVSMTFDPAVAREVGTDSAIILQNIVFWIAKNRANGKHNYEGTTWTYNSHRAFLELFSWLSEQNLRTCIKKLTDKKYLIKGNFNKASYDRTTWYALGENYQMDMLEITPHSENPQLELTNGGVRTNEPIPYINTDIKTEERELSQNLPKIKKQASLEFLLDLDEDTIQELTSKFNCSRKQVVSKAEDLYDWALSSGKKRKDYKALLRKAIRSDYGERKSYLDLIREENPDVIIAQ